MTCMCKHVVLSWHGGTVLLSVLQIHWYSAGFSNQEPSQTLCAQIPPFLHESSLHNHKAICMVASLVCCTHLSTPVMFLEHAQFCNRHYELLPSYCVHETILPLQGIVIWMIEILSTSHWTFPNLPLIVCHWWCVLYMLSRTYFPDTQVLDILFHRQLHFL